MILKACIYAPTARCDSRAPASRARCASCGGTLCPRDVEFGVFEWTGTNRYPRENAVRVFARESAAERFAKTNSDLVVREVSKWGANDD